MSDPASMRTPRQLGYRWPAEWEPHAATWLSWPHNRDSWPGKFTPVPAVFAQFARSLAEFEPVHILAQGAAFAQATELLADVPDLHLHEKATNDCWIRDHGPWFLQHENLPPALVDWQYNAWGGKYPPYADDNAVPEFIARQLNFQTFSPGIIMEGGSVENNGAGVLLVTAQCLLNPNRNPGLSQKQISYLLCEYSGAEEVLWLFGPDDGSIPGDDTDAHIDQLARFVADETILAAANRVSSRRTQQTDYPLLDELHRQLQQLRTRQGQAFNIIPLPMPEPVFYDGTQLPASYANFYIANGCAILPEFGCPQDQLAQQIVSEVYPERKIIGINAVDLVWGLGAFHCASMQQGQAQPR
jgi:agmatine deiminase